jgi:hypothetical protein
MFTWASLAVDERVSILARPPPGPSLGTWQRAPLIGGFDVARSPRFRNHGRLHRQGQSAVKEHIVNAKVGAVSPLRTPLIAQLGPFSPADLCAGDYFAPLRVGRFVPN